jgi:hypothetical protein
MDADFAAPSPPPRWCPRSRSPAPVWPTVNLTVVVAGPGSAVPVSQANGAAAAAAPAGTSVRGARATPDTARSLVASATSDGAGGAEAAARPEVEFAAAGNPRKTVRTPGAVA